MNQSDTPNTDAAWETLCCSGQSWYQIAEDMKFSCRQKERELTAARAEIDEIHATGGCSYIELHKVTEQRDEARQEVAELKQKPCEFCRELPQTEDEKAYCQEFSNTLGQLPSMDEWLQNKTPTQTEPE